MKQDKLKLPLYLKEVIFLKNEINVNINGAFNISSNNGVFDLKAFAKEVKIVF